ncbi:hypothetical protein T492DRAFT_1075669 [Pavlovales sp. CCMP2436]|nr:hypothetical protein T492DRAFT_1075669 [Pavlovales sp. CCMP2436]
MRRNGFARPLDPLQVSSWVVFALFVAATAGLVVPVLDAPAAWVFAGVYGGLTLLTFVAVARTTNSNAVDTCVLARGTSTSVLGV